MSSPARLPLCLALAAGLLLLPVLWRCALPFLLALALARCMERPVSLLAGLGLPRRGAAALVLLAGLGLVGGGLWLTLARLSQELGQLLLRLPALVSRLLENGWLQQRAYALVVAAPVPLQEWLRSTIDGLISGGLALPQRLSDALAAWAGNVLAALPRRLLALITALLAAYYFSADWPRLRALCLRRLPPRARQWGSRLLARLRGGLRAWLRTQGWLMLVTLGELLAGFLLLGVSCPLLAALAGAAVDALPFFGAGTLLLPWALLALLQGRSPVGLLLLYGLTWATRTLLEPRLLGAQAGAPPLLSLAAMYVGFRLLGLWGLLLAPVALFLLLPPK